MNLLRAVLIVAGCAVLLHGIQVSAADDPWFGLLTTAKTPRPVVAKLNREVVRILGLPDVKERLLGLGAEPNPMSPEAFDAHVKAEIAKFSKIVRDANIKVE